MRRAQHVLVPVCGTTGPWIIIQHDNNDGSRLRTLRVVCTFSAISSSEPARPEKRFFFFSYDRPNDDEQVRASWRRRSKRFVTGRFSSDATDDFRARASESNKRFSTGRRRSSIWKFATKQVRRVRVVRHATCVCVVGKKSTRGIGGNRRRKKNKCFKSFFSTAI